MAKRMRSDTLTGGTKDVNMQYTSISVTETAANTFTQGTLNLPVLRGQVQNGKYQVIELLKVMWMNDAGDGASGSQLNCQLTTTSQSGIIEFNNPDVIDRTSDSIVITTSGLYTNTQPIVHDFTDGAGHGLIIATEQVFVGLIGTSQTNALTTRCRLFYRFKNVTVNEFVGLAIQQGG